MSAKEAQLYAKRLVSRKAARYAGLAKRAVSFMMMKTVTKRVNDNVPINVSALAEAVTKKTEIVRKDGDKGHYGLILTDELRYAMDAVKGGSATVDIQTKKAMNKIVSIIRRKTKNLIGIKPPEVPFPELR